MKKTVLVCALAVALSGCCAFEPDYQPAQQQYAYAQPAQPGFTYRSYVQATYTQPVRQQPAMQQRPCGCNRCGCPNCGCNICGC